VAELRGRHGRVGPGAQAMQENISGGPEDSNQKNQPSAMEQFNCFGNCANPMAINDK
jgi:hypothetical protein